MKKIIQLLYLLSVVALFSACNDDNQGEVVSQDLAYQLDANYVFVDIPEEFPFDPSNILYLEGKTVMKLNAKSDGSKTTITEGTEFTFNVKLKKALDQDVKVRLKKDLDLLEGHTLAEFPDEAFELHDAIITAGSREGAIALDITKPDVLNAMPGYVLPLCLEFVDAISGVRISEQRYSVLIEMSLTLEKDNIDPSNDEIEGEYFNNNVLFESSKTTNLSYLYDGNRSGTTWYPGRNDYLTMTFSEPTRILGVRMDVVTNSYKLGSMNVYVDEGSGFISYGRFVRNNNGVIYMKFKEPVNMHALKFDGMLTVNNGTGPDIYEITFIK
ncbi:BT_3987 domain-containing protein [Bacteroides acidifaciens]|uniref:BT_3987 domain-containing protein n=1 Tax=Bacteroides acidifaciens TaxID=85831 RepID=UPI00158CB12A|nr:DUF1735 domain-containing protein [Bacteroides acidifaciens]MDE6820534.1 DUF1735 domain-containing protein [Bacteroides acidifaciens]